MRSFRATTSRAWKFQPTYNVQREFPFRPWFSWAIAVGFGALFALFTVFNIATTGYDLQAQTTSDPNTTLSQRHWFDSPVLTFGDSKLKPTCQAHSLAVGDFFFSSNQGFYYTVTTLSTDAGPNDAPSRQSSVSYLNNTLQNCRVTSVVVNAKKADLSKPGDSSFWWSWSASNAAANAQCDVARPEGVSTISFHVDFAGVTNNFDYVILADPKTRASVWWGTRLLNLAFTGIQTLMSQLTLGPPTTASMTYVPNYNTSLSDPSFFNVSYFFLAEDGGINNDDNSGSGVEYLYNDANNSLSPPLTEGWYFAKIFYSLVLVDLGETSQPNLLLNETLLRSALDPQDDFNRDPSGPLGSHITDDNQIDWWKIRGISPPNTVSNYDNAVPMTEALDDQAFTSVLGPLGTKNATINTQYVCSVPRRKGNATIVLIVFLGNWVLLSSSWVLVKYISTQVVVARDPNAMLCEGCSRNLAGGHVNTVDDGEEWHGLVSLPDRSKLKAVGQRDRFGRSSREPSISSSRLGRYENIEVNDMVR